MPRKLQSFANEYSYHFSNIEFGGWMDGAQGWNQWLYLVALIPWKNYQVNSIMYCENLFFFFSFWNDGSWASETERCILNSSALQGFSACILSTTSKRCRWSLHFHCSTLCTLRKWLSLWRSLRQVHIWQNVRFPIFDYIMRTIFLMPS